MVDLCVGVGKGVECGFIFFSFLEKYIVGKWDDGVVDFV